MATTPKLPAMKPGVDRNRSNDAAKAGRPGDGTGVDILARLPAIYRDQGQKGQGGRHGQGNHTQLAKTVQGARTGLFPSINGRPNNKALFNGTSPASYHEASIAAARWVPTSATEAHRPRWMRKYSSLGGGRMITFNTPAFTRPIQARRIDPTMTFLPSGLSS